MDSLFGISLTSIMVALLLLMAGTLAVLGWIVWRNPLLARMGLRNVARRRAQTTLIVVGLMLSTLIISAAFATGDTVGFSVTTDVYNSLEEADVLLVFDDEAGATRDTLTAADLAAIRGRFGADPRRRRHHRHRHRDAARASTGRRGSRSRRASSSASIR